MNERETADDWDGDEARHWVTEADRYDGQLAPFAELLFDRLRLTSSGVAGDADRHQFAAETFDAVVSRFGVMFFDNPVGAFANLRQALRVGGGLVFVCWQGMEANPWLLIPGVAAAAHVPLPAISGAGGLGMFSLADRDHVTVVLSTAGFSNIYIEVVSPAITLGGGGSLDDSVEFLLGTGIAHALLDGAERDARRPAIDAVTEALVDCFEPGRRPWYWRLAGQCSAAVSASHD